MSLPAIGSTVRLRDLTIEDADRLDAWSADPLVRGEFNLFAATEFHRVEASTDVDNVAEQRSLEKAGFVREGLLRGAQERSGVRHDLVNYARLRTDT